MTGHTRQRSRVASLPWRPVVGRLARELGAARARWELRRIERRLAGPKILKAFAETYPRAFFIEIGANDGEQHDHLRPILHTRPWRGIMVEPVPYVFERLRANYAGVQGVSLENAAIADRDGELPFYHLREAENRVGSGLPSWYDGIGSFSREAVLNHAPLIADLAERLTCVQVPCLTFQSLCRKHAVDRVDLLLVDTEGYDHEILRNVDWRVHRPRLVVFEHYHLSPEQRAAQATDLVNLGYELKEEGFDTWCLQTHLEDELTRTFRALSPGIPAVSALQDR